MALSLYWFTLFFFFFKANANAVSLQKKKKLQYALVHCQRGWDGMGLWPHLPYPSLVFTGDFSTVIAAVFTSVIVHESARKKKQEGHDRLAGL